jgi:hypothetical protein
MFVGENGKHVVFKVTYYGAAGSAVRPTLEKIAARLGGEVEPGDIPMLMMSMGTFKEVKTDVHLYGVAVDSPFPAHRLLVMKSSDGVVFVATKDAAADRERAAELQKHVTDLGYDWATFPVVVQGSAPVDGLDGREATGEDAFATLKAITRLVMMAARGR